MNRYWRTLKALKTMRFYKSGRDADFIWRWSNPITWIVAPPTMAFYIIVEGPVATLGQPDRIGLRLTPHFQAYPELIEWID